MHVDRGFESEAASNGAFLLAVGMRSARSLAFGSGCAGLENVRVRRTLPGAG